MTTCYMCSGKGSDGYHKDEPCSLCIGTGELEAVEAEAKLVSGKKIETKRVKKRK